MASLIPGYEYDIFISYRQKDNKGDMWVSEFVAALKTELESTFKEEISVYFDINPHDGLLETHDVSASLKNKLKCLVFIPIISRTYCDPKSFAWENEFKAFVEEASKDKLGYKVKLANGNVANRVLPVCIHDLDNDDIKLCESVLGGVLRGVEFIYKEPGVDKPLAPEDNEKKNLNNTKYRIQIIKVAHAIKEIILGLKAEVSDLLKEKTLQRDPSNEVRKVEKLEVKEKPAKTFKHNLLSGVVIIAIFIILGVLAFTKVFHSGRNKVAKDPDGRISIAVTVFDNNTNDTTLNWLKKGIPELLRNNLANSKELSVQNSQTMYELYESMGQTQNTSVAPSLSKEAAIKLKTGTYITGSFQMFGNNILTYVKLIDTKSDELLWTGNLEGNLDKYKFLADSLSAKLKDFLEIKVIKQKTSQEYCDVNTNSPEALRKYVEGMQLLINGNFKSAAQDFGESYTLDTTFALAAHYAGIVFSYDYNFIPAVKWSKIAYRGKKRLPYYYQLWIESGRACDITKNCDSVLYYNDLLAQSDIKSRLFWLDIGYNYLVLEQNQKAVKAFEKAETISSEWGGDWKFRNYYIYFGNACHNAGIHDKEAKVYETGLKLFPDDDSLIYSQAICAISKGDTAQEANLLTKLFKLSRDAKISESDIEESLGDMYSEANSLDKAELHYRNALKSDHNNYQKMNSLSFFLIHCDRNVDEVDSLSKKVLKIKPENLTAIWVQGLVCYKHGKYEEALNILQQDYAKNIVWNTTLDKDIKKVKKAIANQK
jgi:tetratricopeptide (TPR) repeat protein/TolB-like protein